jgi:trk system potassium uptake protein TrkH
MGRLPGGAATDDYAARRLHRVDGGRHQDVSPSRVAQRAASQTRQQIYPHGTFVIVYNGAPITDTVRAGITLYFFVYISTFVLFALALALCGLSFEASLGGSAAALGGIGPGLGIIGPCCTFAPLPGPVKWLLLVEMLAGRLEILVLMIPLTRTFWRS